LLIHNPNQICNKRDILSNEDKKSILIYLNNCEVNYPDHKTIHQIFDEQVERMPHNIALKLNDCQMTYLELQNRADSLAVQLINKGVVPNSVVAIMADKDLYAIIGILSILKSGAGYFPIDPDYPLDRINLMSKDIDLDVLLVSSQYYKKSTEFNVQSIILEDKENYLSETIQLKTKNNSNDLAYIIYTSGTTGIPKGVMIEHKNVVRLLFNEQFCFDFKQNDIWTMFHSYNFDFSVWEMFGALLYGGKLVLISKTFSKDILNYLELLHREKVTILNQTPSVFYILSNEETKHQNKRLYLKYVIFGGESLDPGRLKDWRDKYPDTKLVNMYGITETTVHVTYKEIGDKEITKSVNNIGKPIPTLNVCILDKNHQYMPLGTTGELCVAGQGLARGYLNRHDLSLDSFIVNPYNSNEKLYKSGDLAKIDTYGDLIYLGRIDNQVNLRGFRIELGEIESCLRKIKEIHDAVALVREDNQKNEILCAYIISEKKIAISGIRNKLMNSLPEYMVPAFIKQVDQFPLTANSKLSINELPLPDSIDKIGFNPPKNDTQERIAAIWLKALNRQQYLIDINDSFFEIGGNSLLIIKLYSQIHKEFNVKVPITEFYNSPTVRLQAEYIQKAAFAERFIPIKLAQKKEYYFAAPAQKRMFYLQESKNDVSYNMSSVWIVEGLIDYSKLEEALNRIISRHEVLRTSFEIINNELVQRIHKKIEFNVEIYDSKDIDSVVDTFIRVFDLGKPPLFRLGICKISSKETLLLYDFHHIISDMISTNIFLQELLGSYYDESLPEIRIQYKDYTEWLNCSIQKQEMLRQEKFWTDVFKNNIPDLNLPLDYARSAIRKNESDIVKFDIGNENTKFLINYAIEGNYTMFQVLLSVFNVFLSKICEQDEISVGTPVLGRRHIDLDYVIGFFVNTLALVNEVDEQLTFDQLVASVKKNVLAYLDHQEYEFDTLVSKLNIQRDTLRNPLFDVVFVIEDTEVEDSGEGKSVDLPGFKLKPYTFGREHAKFDLTLVCEKSIKRDNLFFSFEYNKALFKRETIMRFAKIFKHLICLIVADTKKEISFLDLNSEEIKKKILIDFNKTDTEYKKEKSLKEIFENQVIQNYKNIAVEFENQTITYQELNERANQLAHFLKTKYNTEHCVIALSFNPSTELIITILGILKCGYSYLPIDPDTPVERINYILKDSGANYLITQYSQPDSIICDEIIIYDQVIFNNYSIENIQVKHSSENLAYIIYTSGSTGYPKGTLISNYNVSRVVKSTNYIEINKEDKILQLSNYAFDGSIFGIFGALLNSATLVLIRKNDVLDTHSLIQTINNHNISIFFLTTALFNTLVDLHIDKLFNIKKILFGGEKVSIKHVKTAFEKLGPDKLIHVYGPTESTVFATYYNINSIDEQLETIPIGSPISNTSTYVLDKNDNLQAFGFPGELCIGGDGLSSGYLNNVELTDFHFINNEIIGERIYRTGDIVKQLFDGNIIFIGRKDNQLKIRGFRVEIGEIQSILNKYDQIKDVFVTAVKSDTNLPYLVAYYTSQSILNEKALKEYMSDHVPYYMIPEHFIYIKKLPLTKNGKVDVLALPKPSFNNENNQYFKPRNHVESSLVKIWSDILEIPKDSISIDSDFFEIGGHSLKVTILVAAIQKEFDVKVAITEVFRQPSIRELSGLIQRSVKEKSFIHSSEKKEYYCLSSVQKRL
jgi:tyrocidine synthetase-3